MTPEKGLTLAKPRAATVSADVLDLVSEWKAYLDLQARAGEMASTTRRTYEIGLEKFLQWCTDRRTVSSDLVLEWIADMRAEGRKPGTINTWLAGVRSFFSWAFRTRRLSYNPVNGVHGAKRTGTSKRHGREALTDREVLRVLAAPSQDTPEGKRDRALLALMAYTAARSIEVHRADLANLQSESNRLVLHVQGKGHQEADELIVLVRPAEDAVRDWLGVRGDRPGALFVSLSNRSQGERLSLRAIRGIVKAHFKAAGVRGKKTTHSLRHTAITNAVRHGAPVQKVQTMARHADISTTMIYYHETDRIENPAEDFINYGEAGA